METVIAVLVLVFVLFLAAGTYVTVKAVGAAKRRVDRTIQQARRTVEDSTLRARARAHPGPSGELAQLRLRLRSSLRSTREALQADSADDASLKETLALFDRLCRHGDELDDTLKRLEAEPDRSALTARLPDLRDRTRRITDSADNLRWAARDRARRFADDDLDTLSAEIDTEAGALRHWTSTTPQDGLVPPGSSVPSDSTVPPERATPPDPRPATGEQPRPDAATADDGRQDTPRPALDPARRQWSTYTWQKKTRPENTT